MQVVSMWKMIVLIILPVPLNTEILDSTLLQEHPSYINAPRRLEQLYEEWTLNLMILRKIPFVVGTSGKTMAFFLILILYGKQLFFFFFWTVFIQLRLKEGKRPLEPGFCWGTEKILEAGLHHGRFWLRRRLPSPADARHVRVKLTGEAAARSPFQEGGPDGWLK